MASAAPATPALPLKSVALPAEHGGWGLAAEPVLIGLAVGPGPAACGVGIAFLAGFLLHHPAKLVLADLRRGARYPRTRAAWRFGAAYALAAAGGLALAAAFAQGPFWVPLAAALPVALVQLGYDAQNRSRHVVPELAGAAALAAAAPAGLLASGWSAAAAASLWLVIAGRGIASVLYVRARLRRDRGQPGSSVAAPLGAHAALVAATLALATAGLVPMLAVTVACLLLARAAWGLSARHRVVRPQAVGFQELGWGVTTALLLVAGYRL